MLWVSAGQDSLIPSVAATRPPSSSRSFSQILSSSFLSSRVGPESMPPSQSSSSSSETETTTRKINMWFSRLSCRDRDRQDPCCQFLINANIVFPCVSFIVWALSYVLFGQAALPGGSIFALGVLEILAILLGHLCDLVKLSPMLGKLAAGFILKNVSAFGLSDDFDLAILGPLRGMAVAVLLTRGALGASVPDIMKFKRVVPQLVLGAWITEAVIGTLTFYVILGFPWVWALMLGGMLSAMSGSGSLPYYARLEKKGLGSDHDAISIVKTGCGLDAILAISLVEIYFGIAFSNGDVSTAFQNGPLETIMGIAYGLTWGTLAGVFLNDSHGGILRTFVVFVCGSISLDGFPAIRHPRGGPIGCWLGAFVVGLWWKKLKVDKGRNVEVSAHMTSLWYIFEPLLFGIIGVRVDFSTVDWLLVERCIFCVAISILFRICAAIALTFSEPNISFAERLFIGLAWVPKGTVQAALGPVALDTALSIANIDPSIPAMAYTIMTLCTVIIVIGSLFGSFLLVSVAPVLLSNRRESPHLDV